jgi:hypothetical protein
VFKESNGGSDRGTTEVANANALTFIPAAATGCSNGVAVPAADLIAAGFPGAQAITIHYSCAQTEAKTTEIGIADVNPALFSEGTASITQGQVDRLSADPLYQPMFAVAVSLNAYRALQRMQGLALTDTLATVPSLRKDQIALAFINTLNDAWSGLVTDVNGVSLVNTTYTNGVTVPDKIYICRRGDESGTQATFAQYFLGERCNSKNPKFWAASTLPASTQQNGLTYTKPTFDANGVVTNAGSTSEAVFPGAGSGDVRACLDSQNDVDHFAIGILGSESTYNAPNSLGGNAKRADGDSQWRYIGLNGVAPTLLNVANGKYDFVMQNVINKRTKKVGTVDPISGWPSDLYDYVKNNFANVTVISTLVVTNTHGKTGGLADALNPSGILPSALPVADEAALLLNPVSWFTKSTSGSVNDCSPAVSILPQLGN